MLSESIFCRNVNQAFVTVSIKVWHKEQQTQATNGIRIQTFLFELIKTF